MEDKIVRYTLRVDRLLFKKFRYIAESEGRSANKEIEQYLKKRIDDKTVYGITDYLKAEEYMKMGYYSDEQELAEDEPDICD